MPLENYEVQCPYCGEIFEVELEILEEKQSFIEDCNVCCRPIQYNTAMGEDGPEIAVSRSE